MQCWGWTYGQSLCWKMVGALSLAYGLSDLSEWQELWPLSSFPLSSAARSGWTDFTVSAAALSAFSESTWIFFSLNEGLFLAGGASASISTKPSWRQLPFSSPLALSSLLRMSLLAVLFSVLSLFCSLESLHYPRSKVKRWANNILNGERWSNFQQEYAFTEDYKWTNELKIWSLKKWRWRLLKGAHHQLHFYPSFVQLAQNYHAHHAVTRHGHASLTSLYTRKHLKARGWTTIPLHQPRGKKRERKKAWTQWIGTQLTKANLNYGF